MSMNKTHHERMWYLSRFYGRGGWNAPRMVEIKKWRAHFLKLQRDGFLEQDGEHDLYRITEAGLVALADAAKKSHGDFHGYAR